MKPITGLLHGKSRTFVLWGIAVFFAISVQTLSHPYDSDIVSWGSMQIIDGSIKSIEAGYHGTVAITEEGTVVAWGHNAQCQRDATERLSGAKAVAAGGNQTVALK